MNRDIERWLIIGLCMILVLMSLQSCTTGKTEANPSETPNINVYNGTLSTVLGCIFAPNECNKFKKEKQNEDLQDDITKEMMEMDEDISKETN